MEGAVVGQRAASAPLEHFGPGQLVFGATAVGAEGGAYDARAARATSTIRIAREDYLDLVEEHFTLARSALKTLSLERERVMNAQASSHGPER